MKQILIVGPSWVGDMVMAQVLFKILKEHHPDCTIDVLAPSWCVSLCERMPEIRHHLEMPLGHGQLQLKARYRIAKQLQLKEYDAAYILPNSFKSALIPFWAKIPKRIGWRGELRQILLTDSRVLKKEKYPLMIQRFAALAFDKKASLPARLPRPRLLSSKLKTQEVVSCFNLNMERPVLSLCPGAEFGPSKQWPTHHFVSVAQHFLNLGWQVWLLGSPNDQPTNQQIVELCSGEVINLAGKTSLSQAVDLLALSKAVISNDSGLMHIASALGLPLVALYGSSSPKFTPPLGQQVLIHKQSLACSPCFKRSCPLHHHRCMEELDPAPVIEAIKSWAA